MMSKQIKKCDCSETRCDYSKKEFNVHVGNFCVHKDGIQHEL